MPKQKSLHLEQDAKSRSLASRGGRDTIPEENILNGRFNLHAADANELARIERRKLILISGNLGLI